MADLITLAEYKTAKGITKTDQDDKLELLIPAVSNLIQTYIRYPVGAVEEVTETITPSYLTDTLHINGYPINSILEVNEVDPYVFGTGLDSTVKWPLLIETGYRYNELTGALLRMSGYWGTVEVTYEQGFEETPEELKLAAIALVDYYLKEQYIQSKTIMGTNVLHTVAKDLPPHVKLILDGFKI